MRLSLADKKKTILREEYEYYIYFPLLITENFSDRLQISLLIWSKFKGYLRYKTINSQNVSSEA